MTADFLSLCTRSRTLLLAVIAWLPVCVHAQLELADEASIARNALKVLDAYHAENPRPGSRKLHVICWRPQDRPFAPDHRERLTRIMAHIQQFYSDEMKRNGFGERTIQLNHAADGLLEIHHAVGEANFADYRKPEGKRVKDDCWPVLQAAGIDPDRETIVMFTNLSDWDAEKNIFTHKSPYYASGNHQAGRAWQLDSPELDSLNLTLKEPVISDGEYGKISLGKHNSIFIGGIAHELGHALGLPHCHQRRDQHKALGTALMGSGNRTYFDQVRDEGKGTFLSLAHALRLASHPQFSGSVKGMHEPVRAEFSDLSVDHKDEHFQLSGKVSAAIPVYAVIAYLDPEGGGDYNARTVCAVPDDDGNFLLDCWPLQRGYPRSDIRVVALIANGATSTWRSSFRMIETQLDISMMSITIELTDFVAALKLGNEKDAREIAAAFPVDGAPAIIARHILAGRSPDRTTISPAKVPAETTHFPLSQIQPAEATVGWQKPAYDHLPREDILLTSGGGIYKTGIYAHANARHVYDLSGASPDWKTLTGKCGLPAQRGGSVVFVIKADGKEVFRTPTVEPGPTHGYEIDLTGVKKLELITEDANDGKALDWGLWLDPMLKR